MLRGLLLLFAILFTAFTQIASAPNRDDMTEFYVLMLGALLGMCLMISANHILIVLLGVEMASVPCYVLAGMQRNRPKSSEAALKYAVFGAGTAGVMLYGMSLLAGVLGSAHLPTMTARLAELIQSGVGGRSNDGSGAGRTDVDGRRGVQAVGGAFPFLGARRVRGRHGRSGRVPLGGLEGRRAGTAGAAGHRASPSRPIPSRRWRPWRPCGTTSCALIALLAAVTCTFGNLAAYGQTNMKRLLAYSTIAHAGYMMMPVAAAVALVGTDLDGGPLRPSLRWSSTSAFTCS